MVTFWKVFIDSNTGKKLGAYTMDGTFEGEEEATKELLAYQHGISVDQIKVMIKKAKVGA